MKNQPEWQLVCNLLDQIRPRIQQQLADKLCDGQEGGDQDGRAENLHGSQDNTTASGSTTMRNSQAEVAAAIPTTDEVVNYILGRLQNADRTDAAKIRSAEITRSMAMASR